MKFHLHSMLLVPPILGLAGFATAKDKTLILYVSPSGNNAHDGRSDTRAFASIDRAQDEIRKLKSVGALPENGITVEILGGKYVLKDSLEFSQSDSGTAKAPVIYRAFKNQDVALLGGRVLQSSEFRPVADEAMLMRCGGVRARISLSQGIGVTSALGV